MRDVFTFAKRNLKLYFRDKPALFMSMLSFIIVLCLYKFFLGDMLIESVESEGISGAGFLMDSWVMAGNMAVIPVSTILGSYGNIIDDKTKRIYKAFRCYPISPAAISGGYILSSFIIGIIMSLSAFIFSEIFICAGGGELLSLTAMLEVFGVIIITVLVSSAMMYFIISLVNTSSAFVGVSTIVGTLIGFLTGTYIPVGSYGEFMQYIIEIFPSFHAASLFRKIFTEAPISQSFDGVPAEYAVNFKVSSGIDLNVGEWDISAVQSIIYLVLITVIFYVAGIMITNRKNK